MSYVLYYSIKEGVYMYKFCFENLDLLKDDLSYRRIFEIYCTRNAHLTSGEYMLDGKIVKISFAEYEYAVRHVADKLLKILEDKPKGSFIAFKVDNCPEWPAYYWGILMAGYKPFMVDFRHGSALTEFFLRESAAVALLSTKDEEVPEGVRIINANDLLKTGGREILDVIGKYSESEEYNKGSVIDRIRSYEWADEMALCTSGTTSTARIYTYDGKAIGNQVLTARHIIASNHIILSDANAKNLAFLPFHHIFGLLAVYLWMSFFGKTMVYIPDRAPSTILNACRNHKVTHILAVPLLVNNVVNGIKKKLSREKAIKRFMFNVMCSLSLLVQKISPEAGISFAKKMFKSVHSNLVGSDIQCIICGGGHVPPETLRVINALGYYTVCGFGMTEVGISSLELRKDVKYRLMGCVGVPVESIEYKIEPIDNANPNVGELFIRGESVHSGTVHGGKINPPRLNEEGWFATGDIGRLEKNALYIEGRLKEVIINESGENVYPDELEDYFSSVPGVSQYCVLGVSNGTKYEDIALVLEVPSIDDEGKKILADKIYKINSSLPVYKKINTVFIAHEALPLSNGIKVKRQALKKSIEEGAGNFTRLDMKQIKALKG